MEGFGHSWLLLVEWSPPLLRGFLASLQIAALGYSLGLMIGLTGAFSKLYGNPVVRDLAEVYTTLIRAIPELVLLLLLYFAGPALINQLLTHFGRVPIDISGFAAGVLVIGIVQGGYSTEVIRGAIQAIPSGQFEAARAIGLSRGQILRRVTLPGMLPYGLAGLSNLWLIATKDTALLAVVGYTELTLATRQAAGATRSFFLFYSAAGFLYLLATFASWMVIRRLQARIDRGQERSA
ncbi:MAG: ABC transporter permease subunit [Candidatus Pacebacteria bacterium]|nr:ABC transporter permease subunit [Candidatus Paceibacterota bacterium]